MPAHRRSFWVLYPCRRRPRTRRTQRRPLRKPSRSARKRIRMLLQARSLKPPRMARSSSPASAGRFKAPRDVKRNADTVVDSITATDIGSFPDKSVAEALQRVPGITVNRFAATSDTAHFSAEPSGVIVRGLPQVRSEFNGRDTFSANSSRGLSWGDITPELMARRRRLQEPDGRTDRRRNRRFDRPPHACSVRRLRAADPDRRRT